MTILNFNPTAAFPVSFGGGGAGGDLIFDNPGQGGRLDFAIYGHVVNPRVVTENAHGTFVLEWDWTLGTEEFLVVDPQRSETLLQGQASRPPIIRQWPRLAPGINTFRFRAGASSESALLVVSALPAD